uniref:Polymerase nucleotidyl transferase domain-containing protein n=1 Tax=Physcomitrium patens TaxID=3218 RepID=A0A7I4A932_PHYPA
MDYPESWPQPNGLTTEGASQFATAFSSAAKLEDGWWSRVEGHTAELIDSIKPTRSSEERRTAVTAFVQRLIRDRFDCKVVKFGSVPLKTYLPDGDIDLTIFARNDLKETWAQDVVKALKQAEEDTNAEFRVKEVQYIQAEVKLIKCLVENIVVDISFNQTGGLSTFCFLEEVDREIDRNDFELKQNHLFKRSVILVKAWCYYESRILGAHHGLISTYALETLVLYIFHVFHPKRRLRGPLEVLYLFLVYFCNFDWDKYCVTMWGPVPLARITEISSGSARKTFRISDFAEAPRKDRGKLLLSKEFLERCIDSYSDAKGGQESSQRRNFITKFLNVLDPIRDTNNLGRSVNVGSFKRIRSAFGLGARTLGEVLECPTDQINEKFKSFFSCTFKSLERYRIGGRPDTGNPLSRSCQPHIPGAGSAHSQHRLLGGYTQENGADPFSSQRNLTYSEENVRPQFQYVSRSGQLDNRARSDVDTAEQMNDVQTESNMRRKDTTLTTDAPFFCNSDRDLGSTVNTMPSASDTKPERLKGTEPGPGHSISDISIASSEGQWRQVSGKGRYPIVDGDKGRVQNEGLNYCHVPEQSEKPMTANRSSTEDHEFANHSRSSMTGEYPVVTPSQDPVRRRSSLGDSLRHGDVPQSRNISDINLPYSAHDVGRPPGVSREFKMRSNHGSFHRKDFSNGENDTSTSERAAAEESGTAYNKRLTRQKDSTSSGDNSSHGSNQDCGDGAGSHIWDLSPHSDEQWERLRPPLEDQVQSRHRTSVSSSASPGLSFLTENPPVSTGSARPGSRTSPMLPQVSGKLKPSSGDRVHAVETTGSRAHGAIDETPSPSLLSDERQAEASSQLEEGVKHVEPDLRSRESFLSTSDVKTSTRKLLKETNGTKQHSRKIITPSDESPNEREVVRSVDGSAADLSLQWLNQPSLESSQASVGNLQAASLHFPLSASTHSYEEMPSVAPSNHHKSSVVQSSTLEPGGTVAYQSLQVPTYQGGAGSDPTSSSTLERKMRSPISASVPGGPSGSFYPPSSEFAAVSMGSSLRNRHIETVFMAIPQPIYNFPTPYYPHIYVFPTGSDGVVRVDTVGGAYSNGSMDSATDILGSRSLEDSRMRAMPQDDILRGDLESHREHLSRSFQYSNMAFPSPNSTTKFQQGPQLWEGSARFHGNPHGGLSIPYPVGVATPPYSSRGRTADGLHQPRNFPIHDNEESLPKSRAGTGTYFPDPRHAYSNRERLRSGGRGGNQHGAYAQQDRKDWEGSNQLHIHRYRNSGQGRGQQNKHEPRAQNMTNYQKTPAADLDGNSSLVQQTEGKRVPPFPSSLPSPTSQNTSSGSPIETSNGHPGMGSGAPPVIMQHSLHEGNARLSSELEFGSLGPVQTS